MNAEVILRTLSNTDVRIAEIYDKRSNNLDYIIMYFCYNPENHQQIEKQINEYRNNKETCLIGCIKPIKDTFFDSEKLASLFAVINQIIRAVQLAKEALENALAVAYNTITNISGPFYIGP